MDTDEHGCRGERRDVRVLETAVRRKPADCGIGELATRHSGQALDLKSARLDAHLRVSAGSSLASPLSSPITHSFGPARTFVRNGSSLRNRLLHSLAVMTCSLTARPRPRSAFVNSARTARVDSSPRTMRSISLEASAVPDANDPKTNASSTLRPLSAGRRVVAGPRSLRMMDDTSSNIADRGSAEYTRRPPAVLAVTNPAAIKRFNCRWTATTGRPVARASSF